MVEGHRMDAFPHHDLLSFLAEIPDPRTRHGRQHSLSAVLGLVCCAITSGARSYAAGADAARGEALNALGQFIVDSGGGHHGQVAFGSGMILDRVRPELTDQAHVIQQHRVPLSDGTELTPRAAALADERLGAGPRGDSLRARSR